VRPYAAFAQAAGDVAAVGQTMIRDVGDACEGLAIELGADPSDPRTLGKLEPDRVRAFCAIAAERYARVRGKLAAAKLELRIVTPRCTVDAAAQTACEARCQYDAACVEPPAAERCPAEARTGICAGVCTGTCLGSETAFAACAGTCSGTCYGSCGRGEHVEDCAGGCSCRSTCVGRCSAACELPPEGATCDAPCAGTCSLPLTVTACAAALEGPRCSGDLDCQNSCRAIAAARATCPEGSLAVITSDDARKDPEVARIVGALERHLPPIFLASRGRAKVLAENASDLLDAAGNILKRTGDIGPMGAACGILIGQTGGEAQKNLNAARAGSNMVADAVTGERSEPVEPLDGD
jgi:hypothetical protein